jgi:DNA-binding MarR family transcriptional regulator
MAGTTTTAPRSAASEAWSLIAELTFRHMKPRFMAIAAEFELSPPQLHALRQLHPEQPVPMSDLATALHCDNSNVTGIVDRLEDRGLVERRPAERDRRVKMLVLTPQGIDLRTRMVARFEEPPEALRQLSEEDQRALRDVMRKALGRD